MRRALAVIAVVLAAVFATAGTAGAAPGDDLLNALDAYIEQKTDPLQAQINHQGARISQLEAQVSQLQANAETLADDIGNLQGAVDELEQRLAALEGGTPPPPADTDGDGVPDAQDSCPNVAGSQPDGCNPPPPPPPDSDGDGVPDADDACPNDAGSQPNGCDPVDPPPPPPSGDCDTIVSSTGAAQLAVSSALPGSVVCLASGSYGSLTVDASKPAPGVTVRSAVPGGAVLTGVRVEANTDGVTVEGFDVNGGIQMWGGNDRIVISHNRVTGSWIGAFGERSPGPVRDVTIVGNSISKPGEDCIRLHEFERVRVIDNECHAITEDGSHNDALQTVHGGSDLTIRGNYLHDQDGSQGLFVKDGAVTGLVIEDNLIVDDARSNGCAISFYETTNATIANNTVWDDSSCVRAASSGNRNVTVEDNVFQTAFKCEAGSQCTVSGNVTGGSPAFVDRAGGDYRLQDASAGITWNPLERHYGP